LDPPHSAVDYIVYQLKSVPYHQNIE
jgi:hypothetical protein